jgi:hypothetical protein
MKVFAREGAGVNVNVNTKSDRGVNTHLRSETAVSSVNVKKVAVHESFRA